MKRLDSIGEDETTSNVQASTGSVNRKELRTLNSIDEDVAVAMEAAKSVGHITEERENGDAGGRAETKKTDSKLSVVSKKYDLNGKGYLDNIEKAMREMDTDNDGQLELHQIYKVLQDHNETQKRFFRVKRVLIAVSVLTVVLALSNLAMAFVAVELSKDFRPNAQGELVTTSGNHVVQTQAVGDLAEVEKIVVEQRMLEDDDEFCAAGSFRFAKMNYDTAWKIFELGQRGCRLMLKYKDDGDTIYMTIPYRNVKLHSGATRQEMRFLQVDDVTGVETPSYTFSCGYDFVDCFVCKSETTSQAKDE